MAAGNPPLVYEGGEAGIVPVEAESVEKVARPSSGTCSVRVAVKTVSVIVVVVLTVVWNVVCAIAGARMMAKAVLKKRRRSAEIVRGIMIRELSFSRTVLLGWT